MKHQNFEKIPFLAAGKLPDQEAEEIIQHVVVCQECSNELDFWEEIGLSINAYDKQLIAPEGIDERVLSRGLEIKNPKRIFSPGLSLLKSQVYLIRKELWPACALLMALALMAVMISDQTGILTFLAPLISAASLAAIYGPQNDAASELTMATAMSPWKILLARLTLVSGYNIILALISSVILLSIIPVDLLGGLIFSWLGPLAMLSALALMLSMWIGTGNSIIVTYSLWIVQFFRIPQIVQFWPLSHKWDAFLEGYRLFWQSPDLLFLLAFLIVVVALYSTRFTETAIRQSIT